MVPYAYNTVIQVGPALFEHALSKFLLNSKSLTNLSPVSAMLMLWSEIQSIRKNFTWNEQDPPEPGKFQWAYFETLPQTPECTKAYTICGKTDWNWTSILSVALIVQEFVETKSTGTSY